MLLTSPSERIRFASALMNLCVELLFLAATVEIFLSLGERSFLAGWALWAGLFLSSGRLLVTRTFDILSAAGLLGCVGLLLSIVVPLPAPVLLLSTAALFAVARWRDKFRGIPALLLVYWVLLLLAFLSERDAQLHMQVMGETLYDGFVLPLLLGFAVTIMLSLDVARLLGSSPRRLCAPYALVVVISTLGIGYVVSNLPQAPALSELSDTSLAPLILLWGAVAWTDLNQAYGQRITQGLGWALLVCVGVLGARGLLFLSGEQRCNRDVTPYPVQSSLVVHLLAAEDPLFLIHRGVDFYRLRRALYETLSQGRYGRGGSTLSMQLAKVCFLSYERELIRKVDQITIALLLELTHKKAELLYSYLESVPFAPQAVGLRAGSTLFYGATPESLTEDQELALVQTIFNPSEFNPDTKVVPRHVRLRTAVIKGLGKRLCPRILGDLSSIDDIKVLPKKCT